MRISTACRARCEEARAVSPELAVEYLEYTAAGDSAADEAIASPDLLDPAAAHRFIEAGMERGREPPAGAPAPRREFFDRFETPGWFDPGAGHPLPATLPGRRFAPRSAPRIFSTGCYDSPVPA